MSHSAAGKALHVVVVLLIVSAGITFLIDLAPGDPAYAILGEQATPEAVANVHAQLRLDDPFVVRYFAFVMGLLHLDFGHSYVTGTPVLESIVAAIPVTLELVTLAFLIAVVISVPLGIYTGYRAGGLVDRGWTAVTSVLISVPPFVMALVLTLVFSLWLKGTAFAMPATGWVPLTESVSENLKHMFLPSFTLALTLVPAYSRLLRDDMVSTLQEDYILAARARGVPTRRILRIHALRQSSFSFITLAGLSLGGLISGAAIVEVMFALPGLGMLIVNAIGSKDVPVVQGVVMFTAIAYVFINMAVDVGYSYLDPRVRLQGAR